MSYTYAGSKSRGDIFICIRSRDLINTSISGYNNSGRFNLFQNIGRCRVFSVLLTKWAIVNPRVLASCFSGHRSCG